MSKVLCSNKNKFTTIELDSSYLSTIINIKHSSYGINKINVAASVNSEQLTLTFKSETEDIIFNNNIVLDGGNYIFQTTKNIIFAKNAVLTKNGNGSISFFAGTNMDTGKVIFKGDTNQIAITGNSNVKIVYHPEVQENLNTHKYHHPYQYSSHISFGGEIKSYMWVNNIKDLQNIRSFLSGNYMLNRDIDGNDVKFIPIKGMNFTDERLPDPFVGSFDGNNYIIKNLKIINENEDFMGLFGLVSGSPHKHTDISNVNFDNISVSGKNYAGILAGMVEFANIKNISISNSKIVGKEIIGGIVGTIQNSKIEDVNVKKDDVSLNANECQGVLGGAALNTEYDYDYCNSLSGDLCFCYE